jgi:hypothetical protein
MKKGYFIAIGKKVIFMETENSRKNPSTVKAMIQAICAYRGFCEDMMARILADKECYERIQKDMAAVTFEEKECNSEKYYSIHGKGFGGSYSLDEVIVA